MKHDVISVRTAIGQAWNILCDDRDPKTVNDDEVLDLAGRILRTQDNAYKIYIRGDMNEDFND